MVMHNRILTADSQFQQTPCKQSNLRMSSHRAISDLVSALHVLQHGACSQSNEPIALISE